MLSPYAGSPSRSRRHTSIADSAAAMQGINIPRVSLVVEGQKLKRQISLANRSASDGTDRLSKSSAMESTKSTGSHSSSAGTRRTSGVNTRQSTAYETSCHMMTLEEVESQFHTDVDSGLDPEYAQILFEEVGPNALTPPEKESELIKWFKHVFCGVFNVLLWSASAGQVGLYIVFPDTRDKLDLIVPAILAIVVFTAGTFQWYQERNSELIMQSFANMIPQEVSVVRGGQTREIPAVDLVPGDVVFLKTGEKIPADVRLIECSPDMQVDNANLTGEAEPQHRGTNCTHRNVMETENVAFFGTLLLKGKGKGVVYYTGDRTFLGKIAGLASGEKVQTTFALEVEHFVSLISWIAISLGIFCMAYDLTQGKGFKVTVYFAISVIIANIPEGLIPTVTLALSLSAKRMYARNVLVRNLEAIETLGSVSVICSDKTGTLTTGVMTVSHIHADGDTRKFRARKEHESTSQATLDLFRSAILCNNTQIQHRQEDDEDDFVFDKLIGFPTETGLFRASMQALGGVDYAKEMRASHEMVHEIPFNSDNKWQMSIHRVEGDDRFVMVMKGAPERILNMCGHYIHNGETLELTQAKRDEFLEEVLSMCKLGERVLCFAQAYLDPVQYPPDFQFHGDHLENVNWKINGAQGGVTELNLLGFMSMVDPPRDGVKGAITQCHRSGIKVVMVTGDHKVTAEAIAKQTGIIPNESSFSSGKSDDGESDHHIVDVRRLGERQSSLRMMPGQLDVRSNLEEFAAKNYIVVTGEEINRVVEKVTEESDEILKRFFDYVLSFQFIVFARTSPQQKMLIVQAFQDRGMIVAVTGDGVNDAPALNQAHVGVAMGRNGTDVARDAADIILLDDNFTSIVNGIEEGRLITDNLKKSIAYTLCSKLPQIAPTFARNIFGIPLAMTMMQIILIDLGTDIWTGVAMAYEEKEDDIMARKPRDLKKEPMVTSKTLIYSYLYIGVMQTIGCFTVFFRIMYDSGHGVDLISMFRFGLSDNRLSTHWGKQTLFCYTNGVCEHNAHVRSDLQYSHHLLGEQQTQLLRRGQTAFYVTLILLQVTAAICAETRVASVFANALRNIYLNICLIFEILLGLLVVYSPLLQDWFETAALDVHVWFMSVPFITCILAIEELRKYNIRRNEKSWGRALLF